MKPAIGSVGTLKELRVRPGDVVDYAGIEKYTVGENNHLIYKKNGVDAGEYLFWNTCSNFTLISRATPEPKTWGEMTDTEKGAILLAAYNDVVIQEMLFNAAPCAENERNWVDSQSCKKREFHDNIAYRAKPEPKRDTVAVEGIYNPRRGWIFDQASVATETHRITFDTIDGEPDCASVRMEKIK